MSKQRWYATNHILPDGRQIIIGGRQAFNYEFYPKASATENSPSLPFLVQTNDPNVENNLYPFVFLYPDGNLFIFANTRAILFDYSKNEVIKTYPTIPDGQPRNYPSTGSAVLLPLRIKGGIVNEVEVLVCGGAPKGAFVMQIKGFLIGHWILVDGSKYPTQTSNGLWRLCLWLESWVTCCCSPMVMF